MIKSHTRHSAQHGAVLFVSLLLLLTMSILGVVSMQNSNLQERMAGNFKESHRAFQAAEAGLRTGEDYLETYFESNNTSPKADYPNSNSVDSQTATTLTAQSEEVAPTYKYRIDFIGGEFKYRSDSGDTALGVVGPNGQPYKFSLYLVESLGEVGASAKTGLRSSVTIPDF